MEADRSCPIRPVATGVAAGTVALAAFGCAPGETLEQPPEETTPVKAIRE